MNCQECEHLLPDFVSGALAPAELVEVRCHLASQCPRCHEELDRLREAFAALALSTAPVTPPGRVRRGIMARVGADLAASAGDAHLTVERATASTRLAPRRWSWRAAAPYIAVTLCAVLAGVASVHWADRQVASREALERDFQRRMADARRLFPSPQACRASLGRIGATAADGQLVWDSVAGEVHFYAYNLGFPATDSHFQLWFVDADGAWAPVGRLQPAANGGCSALLAAPAGLTNIQRAVVTEEPNDAAMDRAGTTPVGPERMVADFTGRAAE